MNFQARARPLNLDALQWKTHKNPRSSSWAKTLQALWQAMQIMALSAVILRLDVRSLLFFSGMQRRFEEAQEARSIVGYVGDDTWSWIYLRLPGMQFSRTTHCGAAISFSASSNTERVAFKEDTGQGRPSGRFARNLPRVITIAVDDILWASSFGGEALGGFPNMKACRCVSSNEWKSHDFNILVTTKIFFLSASAA